MATPATEAPLGSSSLHGLPVRIARMPEPAPSITRDDVAKLAHLARIALTDAELDQLVLPPLPPLAHDAAWFRDVAAGHPHAAVLSGLRDRFR